MLCVSPVNCLLSGKPSVKVATSNPHLIMRGNVSKILEEGHQIICKQVNKNTVEQPRLPWVCSTRRSQNCDKAIPFDFCPFKPIQVHSSSFQLIQVHSSPIQPIQANSSIFQAIPAYFDLFQPTPAYSSIFKPIPAYSSIC